MARRTQVDDQQAMLLYKEAMQLSLPMLRQSPSQRQHALEVISALERVKTGAAVTLCRQALDALRDKLRQADALAA